MRRKGWIRKGGGRAGRGASAAALAVAVLLACGGTARKADAVVPATGGPATPADAFAVIRPDVPAPVVAAPPPCVRIVPADGAGMARAAVVELAHQPGGMVPAARIVNDDFVVLPIGQASIVGRVASREALWPSPLPWAVPKLVPWADNRASLPPWMRIDARAQVVVTPPPELAGAAVEIEVVGGRGATVRKLLAFGEAGAEHVRAFRTQYLPVDRATRVRPATGPGEPPCKPRIELAALVADDLDGDGNAELVGYLAVHCETPDEGDVAPGQGELGILRPGPVPWSTSIPIAISEAIFFPTVRVVPPSLNGGAAAIVDTLQTCDGVWADLWSLETDGARALAAVRRDGPVTVCLVPAAGSRATLKVDDGGGPPRIR